MKIIFSNNRSEIEMHAKRTVRKLREDEFANKWEPKPQGVARHLAAYAQVCDDCEETYWSRDPFSSHARCKGAPPRGSAGFG